MEFLARLGDALTVKTECLVLGVSKKGEIYPNLHLGEPGAKHLKEGLNLGEIISCLGQVTLIPCPDLPFKRIALLGLGDTELLTETLFKKAIQGAFNYFKKTRLTQVAFVPNAFPVKGRDLYWKTRFLTEAAFCALSAQNGLKTLPPTKVSLKSVTVLSSTAADNKVAHSAISDQKGIAKGVDLAKAVANLPANLCTPSVMAEHALLTAKAYRTLTTRVLNRKDLEKLKMGAFLSVTKGSEEPPKFIVMEYRGTPKKQKPLVFVGKGITFDSGGISLKSGDAMDEMKFDMGGAAAVLGLMKSLAELKLAVHAIGVMPCCENLPDGKASKPGDVVTSMSGQTIEVLNTDAEGRLILCDALTYCERFNPEAVIDIATLTGACMIALGKHASGLFTPDEQLSEDLLNASFQADDKAWRLPLWEVYQEQLDSNFADMANVGGKEAGSTTAACFLWRFTKKYRWAHLDIAGTAWLRGKEKGATGRPVPLLVQFVMNRCGKGR